MNASRIGDRGSRGASFDLAGVDDHTAHSFGPGHGADYAQALGDRDPERELVLLAHQPSQIVPAAPLRRGPSALGAHPWRANLALWRAGSAEPALRRGPSSP